jgi:RNA-directed DNA polymerase
MTKTPIELQDLRRKIYTKAKADFGWDRWSRRWLYDRLGLFNGYRVSRPPKALPTGEAP